MNSGEIERLRLIRKSLKYSQQQFAETIGMTQGGYSAVERGHNSIARKVKILLTNIHRVNLDFLETGEGNMFLVDSRQAKLRDPKDVLLETYEGEIKRLNAEREMHIELLKSRDSTIAAQQKTIQMFESLMKSDSLNH